MATKLAQILADFTTSLASELVVGGTTATLSTAVDDDGVALPSGRYFFTLDNSNTSKEHISCDLVGTALTNIKSVSRQGVETTGTVRKHRIGATVTLTDFGHIKFMNDLISGATQLNAGAPLGYDGAPSALTGNQLATVTYVLGVVNGGTVTFDQQIISNQTSGEAIAVNDVVYFKEADAKWYKADADLTATFDQLQIGICKTVAGASGVTIQVAISGPVSGFTGLTAGAKYYLSNTAGAITTTAGTNSVFIGWALTTTTLLFNPILKTLPSQKEKDAMVGSQGVPSTTNKYITQDNVTVVGTDQTQTTQDATIETGEANVATKRNKIAQSFTAGKTKVRGLALWKTANTGTFTGTVTVSLQADTTGSPSGTALLTKTLTNAEYNALSVGAFDVMFSSEYSSLVLGSTYWIVIETSTSDTSNHPNFGTNSAGGYSGGSVKTWNTTDGWTAVATIDLYFKTYEGINSQVVSTDSTGKINNSIISLNFSQRIPVGYEQENSTTFYSSRISGFTQNSDGSVFFVKVSSYRDTSAASNMIVIYRYEKDSITNSFSLTHSVDFGGNTNSASMFINGDYLYVIEDYGAVIAQRYLASDLTGVTACSGISTIGSIALYGVYDGTHYYHIRSGSSSVKKYTVSGTVFTDTGTTITLQDFGVLSNCQFIDGGINAFHPTALTGSSNKTILTVPVKQFKVDGTLEKTTNLYIPAGDMAQANIMASPSTGQIMTTLGYLYTNNTYIRYLVSAEYGFISGSAGDFTRSSINLKPISRF